ncbi:hypothetical protein QZH56_36375 [Streptomyces olivoreticuli]|uniref:hypothetical protein n=1 Tax=Streptomyces olivoreticuli TaxID=68246 RepID=UPI00265974A4|nr:hypothetical protein [Streptomyces olivoreticuli]WKK24080.1 hypothetical protein QZH56_36375 [Streptomyces olivoreticuli]
MMFVVMPQAGLTRLLTERLLLFRSRAVSLERESRYQVIAVGAGHEKAAYMAVSAQAVG